MQVDKIGNGGAIKRIGEFFRQFAVAVCFPQVDCGKHFKRTHSASRMRVWTSSRLVSTTDADWIEAKGGVMETVYCTRNKTVPDVFCVMRAGSRCRNSLRSVRPTEIRDCTRSRLRNGNQVLLIEVFRVKWSSPGNSRLFNPANQTSCLVPNHESKTVCYSRVRWLRHRW